MGQSTNRQGRDRPVLPRTIDVDTLPVEKLVCSLTPRQAAAIANALWVCTDSLTVEEEVMNPEAVLEVESFAYYLAKTLVAMQRKLLGGAEKDNGPVH